MINSDFSATFSCIGLDKLKGIVHKYESKKQSARQ